MARGQHVDLRDNFEIQLSYFGSRDPFGLLGTLDGAMPSHWRGGTGCACPGAQSCPGGKSCCGGELVLASRNRGYVIESVAAAEGLRSKNVLLCFFCAGKRNRAVKPRAKHTAETRRVIANAKRMAEERAAARERGAVLRRPSGAVGQDAAESAGEESVAVGGEDGGQAVGSADVPVAAGAGRARRGEEAAERVLCVGPAALRAAHCSPNGSVGQPSHAARGLGGHTTSSTGGGAPCGGGGDVGERGSPPANPRLSVPRGPGVASRSASRPSGRRRELA